MRLYELLAGKTLMAKTDNPAWFSNPGHTHAAGIDAALEKQLQATFRAPEIEVDCGVDGNSYHFRIGGVPVEYRGQVSDRARDYLAQMTPHRFEVQCV